MKYVLAIFFCTFAAACADVELARDQFACGFGGPCLEDAAVSIGDARIAADATNAVDAGQNSDGSTGVDALGSFDSSAPDASTTDASNPDASSGCNAGPSGTWRRVTASGATARSGHSALVDAPRNRALIFGGAGINDELVALSLDGTFTFSTISTSGSGPGGRREHGAVLDPARNIMLIFGGLNLIDYYLGDTYSFALGTNTWDENSVVPSVRASVAASYGRDETVLFGGCSIPGAQGDSWVFDDFTESWHAFVRLDSPDRRCDAAVAAINGDGTMLLHGGESDGDVLADTWVLGGNGPDWTEIAAGPSARSEHSAAWDADRSRTLFYGGRGANGVALDELWALTTSPSVCWSRLTPAGAEVPSARVQHTAFVFGGKMYLYGGTGISGALDDLWELTF